LLPKFDSMKTNQPAPALLNNNINYRTEATIIIEATQLKEILELAYDAGNVNFYCGEYCVGCDKNHIEIERYNILIDNLNSIINGKSNY